MNFFVGWAVALLVMFACFATGHAYEKIRRKETAYKRKQREGKKPSYEDIKEQAEADRVYEQKAAASGGLVFIVVIICAIIYQILSAGGVHRRACGRAVQA